MKRLDQEPLADWTRRVLEDERAQWDPLTLRDALRAWLAEYGQRQRICGGCGGHGFDRDSDGWVRGICKGCGGTGELRP